MTVNARSIPARRCGNARTAFQAWQGLWPCQVSTNVLYPRGTRDPSEGNPPRGLWFPRESGRVHVHCFTPFYTVLLFLGDATPSWFSAVSGSYVGDSAYHLHSSHLPSPHHFRSRSRALIYCFTLFTPIYWSKGEIPASLTGLASSGQKGEFCLLDWPSGQFWPKRVILPP